MAIAEACGALHHRWGRIVDGNPQCEDCFQLLSEDSSNHCVLAEVPDFTSDLNAMHTAKKVLNPRQRDAYAGFLGKIVGGVRRDFGATRIEVTTDVLFAEAAQEAEALLKAIERWVES